MAPRNGFIRLLFATAALLHLAVACGSAQRGDLPAVSATTYRLDTNDTVRITVFGQEELTDQYTVDSAGTIAMPLIGAVEARSRSETELERTIAAKLSQGFLRDPSVSVEVVEYRPFYILGEVRSPGQYPYRPGMTVQSAVAVGGGYTYRARKDEVLVARRRADGSGVVEAAVDPVTEISPGDVITIRERLF